MKAILPLVLTSSLFAFAADVGAPSPSEANPVGKTTMVVAPKERALDYQQAFELLRKEKSANKVYFQLCDGSTITNIIDMKIMGNGSLILFRFDSVQGIRFQTVKTEDIVALKNS